MTTRYDYLVVGGGMVADAAARGIRERDARGTIGILSADVEPPYTRPALSKKLWTDPEFDWDQVPLGTTEATGAELRLETLVTRIDRDAREVTTAAGETIGYGALLLATGSTPARLAAPDDDRIIHFRSAEDYRALRRLAGPGVHVAVVGGGYIGAELAAALSQEGSRVTLVHPDAVLGGSQLPASLAEGLESRFRDAGVEVLGGVRAERAEPAVDAVVVHLGDGRSVGADVVVVGLGATPVTELAEQAGLPVDDGVVVDAHLRTEDPAIWAAGDIARYPDAILGPVRIEHVDHAEASGRAAGRSMAGDTAPYEHTPYFYTQVFDVRWEAVGTLDASLPTLEERLDDDRVVVYYLDGERAIGVLLWKVEERRDAARAVLRDPPATREELVGAIR
ncbi:NAD(P)/FAD-dependent oxidoreductase [Homoserinibacter sp. YIM 151385]|uniref:NAD(P)/FAD-dependent oxidoreductase n=1 Tax=Homoserinibacter sp. YIM 151385 TaxID=2985506 RepID=UPI0022F0C68E|nr:FAD-dependent oxidoreductase [Homoserinibacter sp. YIM 151385]WBU37603.1 FAD-dependent oxidoreductase [Homoserinibacter sp. YIM 151385]